MTFLTSASVCFWGEAPGNVFASRLSCPPASLGFLDLPAELLFISASPSQWGLRLTEMIHGFIRAAETQLHDKDFHLEETTKSQS